MRTLLSRSSLLGALLMLPGCATLAQDPNASRTVAYYSTEELDNLVAPVALYPDALLAQILVAATFPEQIEIAARHVRERGTRDIDNQGWDLSVKAVAYYPPILNMLYNQDDWSIALGQAYAAQSADVMDAVQRLREMAREQGNLVSTPEHTVTYDRDRIIIVPANPQVIYVPTYDPAIVFVRPLYGLRFHGGYFSFGIGFPIGSWLVYDVDWWGGRVYYDGWYGGGWRTHARRYIHVSPVYVHPRYRVININVNIFSRRVNYLNLDRRHRYVRRTVQFDRPGRDRYVDRDGRRADRGGYRDDDRRGPIDVMRDRYDRDRDGQIDGSPADRGGRDDGNDRIGNRLAEFDDFRPDRGGNTSDAREREPVVTRGGFGTIEKPRDGQPRSESNGNGRSTAESRGSRPSAPVFVAPSKSTERKSNGSAGGATSAETRGARPQAPVFRSQPRTVEPKSSGNGRAPAAELRGSKQSAPTFQSQPRTTQPKASGNGRPPAAESRGSKQSAPTFQSQPRATQPKSSGNGRAPAATSRGSRQSAPTFQSQPRTVERKSSGGQVSRPSSARVAPSRPSATFSGGGGKVKQSSGGGGGGGGAARASGGGKGRKQ